MADKRPIGLANGLDVAAGSDAEIARLSLKGATPSSLGVAPAWDGVGMRYVNAAISVAPKSPKPYGLERRAPEGSLVLKLKRRRTSSGTPSERKEKGGMAFSHGASEVLMGGPKRRPAPACGSP